VGAVVDEVAGAEATVVEGAADEKVNFPEPPQPPARMATAARTLAIAPALTLAFFLAKGLATFLVTATATRSRAASTELRRFRRAL
jgi:hypothetical protein